MEMIRINGVGLELRRIEGPNSLAPIVFLHEGLGSVAMWRDWPAQVCAATGRRGIVYSRRGYGGSEAIPDVRGEPRGQGATRCGRHGADYMHVEAREVLPALLQALGIKRPVLLGHSDGGTIALLHAADRDVSACLVMAPHVIVEDVSVSAISEARAQWEATASAPSGLRSRLARYHDDVDCAFWQWNDVWLSAGFRGFDIREECRRIRAPLLAVQGFGDAYGTMAQIEAIAERVPQASTVKLRDCGHSPHRDQAALTLGLVRGFLAQLA